MSLHSFDPDIAKVVGVNPAIIYQNVLFWTKKNMANGRNVHDGHVWTYNSVKAWADLFPYLSRDQVRRALAKLVEAGLIAEGNYNQSAYDRTKWYGVPCQIHLAETANGFEEKPKPIPDDKPNDKPDSKPTPIVPKGTDEDFEKFWAVVPKKVGKAAARKAWRKACREVHPETIIAGMELYARQRQGQDHQYTAHPATWLNAGRWEDEAPPSPQDFHSNLDAMLKEHTHGLPSPNADGAGPDKHIPPRISAPAPSGRSGRDGRDENHGGGNQQSHLHLIRPKRFP